MCVLDGCNLSVSQSVCDMTKDPQPVSLNMRLAHRVCVRELPACCLCHLVLLPQAALNVPFTQASLIQNVIANAKRSERASGKLIEAANKFTTAATLEYTAQLAADAAPGNKVAADRLKKKARQNVEAYKKMLAAEEAVGVARVRCNALLVFSPSCTLGIYHMCKTES